jgi:hypothetical protein
MADDSYQLGYRSDQDGIRSVNFEIPEERDLGSSRFWLLANRHMLVFLKPHKGPKATSWLERVYIDLCDPMVVASCAGNLYSMNLWLCLDSPSLL